MGTREEVNPGGQVSGGQGDSMSPLDRRGSSFTPVEGGRTPQSYRDVPLSPPSNGSGPASSSELIPLTNERDQDSLEWYSTQDVARLAKRSECTIRAVAQKHGLPFRSSWETFRRRRFRVISFRKDVARWIVEVTRFRMPPVAPPR
jgi:hypothetical protein